MNSDIDIARQLRDAFAQNAERITSDKLREPTYSPRTPTTAQRPRRAARRRQSWRAVVASAAAVIACVGVVGYLVAHDGSGGSDKVAAGNSSHLASVLVGYRWRLLAVTTAGRTTHVPKDYDAFIDFQPNHQLVTVYPGPGLAGSYRITDSHVDVSQVSGNTMGLSSRGVDPVTAAVSAGIRSMFGADTQESHLHAQFSITYHDSRFVAATSRHQLTFARYGPIPANEYARVSSTPTVSSTAKPTQ